MMSDSIKTLWHISGQESVVRTTNEKLEGPVIIRSLASLISLGTELTIARGLEDATSFNEMRVPYMLGLFDLPVAFGYSLVGEVTDAPDQSMVGRRVHVMHPHQSMASAHPEECFIIPDAIPTERATLASNMETAVNAIWDAKVQPGDTAVVIGFGLIGSLIARLLTSLCGVDCSIIEPTEKRSALFRKMGFSEYTGSMEPDLVFHCSGQESGLQRAIDIAGFEGRILELSWYGSRKIALSLGRAFHMNRLRIISSQVSHLPAHKRSKWDKERRKAFVFKLLEDPVFDQHLGKALSLEEAARGFTKWREEMPGELSYVVRY